MKFIFLNQQMIKNKNIEIQQALNLNGIILFDGFCNLCSWSVQFILKRDSKNYFKFASLQSDSGKLILSNFNLPRQFDKSVIFIENNSVYFKSEAAIHIVKKLRRGWPLLYSFKIIPKPIRDYFYVLVSKNRFKWFGKRNTCYIPIHNYSYKFL